MTDTAPTIRSRRRSKRDKDGQFISTGRTDKLPGQPSPAATTATTTTATTKKKPKSKRSSQQQQQQQQAHKRHGKDAPTGGMESLLPSFLGLGVLVFAVMAQRGFRGRASVAGIDLGTTNSVICVQAPSKGVGVIDCIPDPYNGSPIVPSVVSFLELHERRVGPSSKTPSKLHPHPSHVVVGHPAKQRIDTNHHHTLYNAKRVLGRPFDDPSVQELQREVEFSIVHGDDNGDDDRGSSSAIDRVRFKVVRQDENGAHPLLIPPQQVGSYVVNHLMQLAKDFLGHDNVQSAVLAVPAKFNALQRQRTMEAFKNAGVTVARVLEEPTAAALAYGLHKKEGVEKILVYDFGGGTLDISILHVSEGYAEVMGSDGDDRLGGADFDAAVAHVLTKRYASPLESLAQHEQNLVETLSAKCDRITDKLSLCSVSSFHTLGERLKISLSQQLLELENTGGVVENSMPTATTSCWAVPPPKDQNENLPLASLCQGLQLQELTISLEDYNLAVQPLFDRSILPVSRLLKELTLTPPEIDEIVMVGGTTRMPQIRTLVRDAFSTAQLNTHIDPDLTVAYGAASVID